MTAPSKPIPQPKQATTLTDMHILLSKVRIVMINTTLPANIGSAARAMHTMGLSDLIVVNPKHPIDETSHAHAAGAADLLDSAQVVETLDNALTDCQLVFAASSRQRHIPRPVVTPTQAAHLIKSYVNSANMSQVAVLFGREDRGLTNEELAQADYHIQIEANPAYPVLNVASAIQVIAGFFYSVFNQQQSLLVENQAHHNTPDDDILNLIVRQAWDTPAINQTQKQQLQSHTIELMQRLQLIDSTNTGDLRDLPNRLSRLISRVQLDQKEYELLNSIIAKIKRRL